MRTWFRQMAQLLLVIRGSIGVTTGPVRSDEGMVHDWLVMPLAGLGVLSDDGRVLHRPADVLDVAASGNGHVALLREDGSSVVATLPDLEVIAETPACRAPLASSPAADHVFVGATQTLGDGTCDGPSLDVAPVDVAVVTTGSEDVLWSRPRREHRIDGAFGPPDVPLLVVSDQVSLEFVDTRDWSTVTTLRTEELGGDEFGFLALRWEDDSGHLVVGTSSGRTIVLDGRAVAAGTDAVDAIVFDRVTNTGPAPDPDVHVATGTVASYGFDDMLRLWDLDTGDLRLEVETPSGAIPTHVDIRPDGRTVLHRRGDGAVHRLLLDPEEAIATARSLLVRDLSVDECARYGLDPC